MKDTTSAEQYLGGGSGSCPTADGQETVPPRHDASAFSLWLWVAAGFGLLVLAWAVMFSVARSARVESVPLVTKEAKP